ncbi:MAG: hypothetical protein M3437_10960 [Chloroflexota bacterium]|nr:hypothetical protein [Chloroflexota bacterium]MDQ5866839.1 hypothetical protein [Chloroflexota bacterium]
MITPLFRVPALSLLGIILLLLLVACGPAAATAPDKNSTNTPVSAQVPSVPETVTPPPQQAYPAATDEDIQLIKKALAQSSAANLKSYHFVMTTTMTGWDTTVTEGDVSAPEGQYMKVTQGDSVQETLILGNSSYCKDSNGKWIVVVADLEAQQAEAMVTMQAEMGDYGGFPEAEGTVLPAATTEPYDYEASEDLAGYGSVHVDMHDFYYAGEETIEGVRTRRYIGEEDWFGNLMPPDATEIVDESEDAEEQSTLSLWIDTADSYVRKLEHTFHFSPASDMLLSYAGYGCGVEPSNGPTPTIPSLPEKSTWTTTIVYSRLNDPSVTLPKP